MQALRNNEPLPNTPQAMAASGGDSNGSSNGGSSSSNFAPRRRVVTSLFMNNGASSGGLTPRKAHGTMADNARPFLTVCAHTLIRKNFNAEPNRTVHLGVLPSS
jgi:hypothetical protein